MITDVIIMEQQWTKKHSHNTKSMVYWKMKGAKKSEVSFARTKTKTKFLICQLVKIQDNAVL